MSDTIVAEVDRWAKEVRRGSTRLAVLAVLAQEESYGYAILSRMKATTAGAVSTTEATVYPILHDLEARGHVTSAWRQVEDGVPPRKYYKLTAEGTALLGALRGAWADYRSEMDSWMEAPR